MKTLRYLLIVVPIIWMGFGPLAYSDGLVSLDITEYPINITASSVQTWEMEGVRVFSATGDARITQGRMQISSNEATCWFYELEAQQKPSARMEILSQGNVVLIQGQSYEKYEEVYLHLETGVGVMVDTRAGGSVQTFGEEQRTGGQLKMKEIKKLALDEFAYREPLELELEGGPPGEPPTIDIIANDLDSWVEGDTRIVVAAGDVEFKRGTQSFKADNAILWFSQDEHAGGKIANFKEFYAEGNVTIIATGAKDEMKYADKAFENIAESKGFFVNPRFRIVLPAVPMPLYVGGKEMKQITRDEFEIRDGYTTSCSFGYPHLHIKSPRVKIRRRVDSEGKSYSEIKAYDNVFYIGDLPAGYLPVYKYDTRKKEALLSDYGAGSSNRFGAYVTTEWNPYLLPFIPPSLGDWSQMRINVDYLHKRGPALGAEFDYWRDDIGMEGFLQTFYVNDKLGRDEATPREEFSNRNRGRILWRDRLYITDDLRVDNELSYLSDRDFLREYFERELLEGKSQETYLNLRRLKDNRGAVFLVKDQLNDFQTGLEAYPRVTYEAIGQSLFDNRLNLTSKSDLGYLEFQIDEGLEARNKSSFDKLTATTGSSVRFDMDNTVSMPFTFKMFKLNPFVGNRITAYSKSLEDGGPNGSATGRYIGSIGLEGSAQFWRVYSLENKLFRINGLRHITTPIFRWIASPAVTRSPDHLLQYERSDGLDTYNSAVIGLRNRLQTRRGPPWKMQVIDLLEFDAELHLYSETKQPEDKEVTYTMMTAEGSIIPRRHGFLQLNVRAQPTNRLAISSVGNEYDFKSKALEVFNMGLSFRKSENWSYFAGYRFIKGTSSTVILGANVLVGEKWGVAFSESFDLGARTKSGDRTAKNLFSNFSFTRESHDWVGGVSASFDVANNDKSIGFVLAPKGISRSLGRSYSFKGRTAESLP